MTEFLKDEDGATMAEYGLLATLIALVALAGVSLLGNVIGGMFQDSADGVNNLP